MTPARFTGARFGTPVLGCPDGAVDLPLPLNILVDAEGGSAATAVTSVSAVLIIKESPAFPGEVGFAKRGRQRREFLLPSKRPRDSLREKVCKVS